MNDLTDPDLWNKIASYDFDDPQAEAPFSVRLARENGWTPGRAKAAIDQYRRFIYLVCISDDMLSPSPDVDKVWHLHLTYTKDYWKRFCDETLGQEVHHHPSRGADESQVPLRDAYARTLVMLSEEFGEDPVSSVWPDVNARERPLSTGLLGMGSHDLACRRDHLRPGTGRDYGFAALEQWDDRKRDWSGPVRGRLHRGDFAPANQTQAAPPV